MLPIDIKDWTITQLEGKLNIAKDLYHQGKIKCFKAQMEEVNKELARRCKLDWKKIGF